MKTSNAAIFTEEILVFLAYGIDLMTRPTFRNWDDSYEGWLSRNGLLRRMHYLEKQKFLIREGKRHAWAYKLSESGRLLAQGGRDPERQWRRPWDGWWRQMIFDLPVGQQRARSSLIRWLRSNGFGYLQDSVWMSPDPVDAIAKTLKPFREDAASFTVLRCQCEAGFANASLVLGAWPFDGINEKYKRYIEFASTAKQRLKGSCLHPRDLFLLIRAERRAWADAFDLDPLLPMALWPKQYEGHRAWETRRELLGLLQRHVPAIKSSN